MKQLELLDKKQKIILISIIIFIIAIILFYFYTKYQKIEMDLEETEDIAQTSEENSINSDVTEEQLIIHISGAVQKEGIVKLNKGARISDVIELAGGLKDTASLKNVNLAYMVEDGQKIYIPTQEEEREEDQKEKEREIIQEGNNNTNKQEDIKVNINKATQTELEELPGIGASTALKIIQYREENGKFQTIEDIKNVSGIGESKFDNIKEYITI